MSIQDTFTNSSNFMQEPIPGYRLLERLGRGGYGEVWKTLAPGGVPKAIKLIYGDDPSRMLTELKAINRIKDVRHPFLLSIERIEQNGDLLAIVTELGDQNLQQHFQKYRDKEMPGVPQDELLGLLRDVADVLDYIYQEYALQHLDIKPANLLLFGKRLKVADFGLVKNLHERSASLVHGLTPTYAAPEIFEGQPTRATDQYSLAVLYQEMLTGVLPFNGTTAARLATQHLRDAPDLNPLPSPQRPVIARALSKDPQRRFSSCTELVEELIAAARRPAAVAATTSQGASNERAAEFKQSGGRPAAAPASTQTSPTSATNTEAPAKVPAYDCNPVPTIVIGVGGTAGKALRRLGLRMADRQQGAETLRAFKMLFLDIDSDALIDINHSQQTFIDLETIPTPLRSSAEYREQGQTHRRWMSRRWLFNVPRNLRTEGLRPFGRLALISNAKRILTALRSAIQNVTSACHGTPRVLLVGSISGGTGSGMLPDLAYAMRHELRNAGFPEVPIDGILLHSTPAGAGRDKAILNAIATLGEIRHYSEAGSFYPGEPLLQIPPFHGDNQTFASTQFLHLGEELDEPTWLRAIDNVAEHLYCRLLTNLDQAFNRPGSHSPSATQSVDLVQVHQIGGYRSNFVDEVARRISLDVIDGWCATDEPSAKQDARATSATTMLWNTIDRRQNAKNQNLDAQSEAQTVACGIDIDPLLQRTREILQQEIAVSPPDFLRNLFSEAVQSINDDVPDHEVAGLVVALQDRAIGLDFGERPAGNPRNTLFDVLNPRLTSQAMPIAARFLAWIGDLVDQRAFGVDAARQAAESGRNCIRDLIGAMGKQIQERQTKLTRMRIVLTSPPSADAAAKSHRGSSHKGANARTQLSERLVDLGLCSFDELLDVLVHFQLRAIEANVSIVIDQLLCMRLELKQLGERIGKEAASTNVDIGHCSNDEQMIRHQLMASRRRLVDELIVRIEEDVLSGPKKLQRFLDQRCSYDQAIGDPIGKHARQVVLHSIKQMLGDSLKNKSQDPDGQGLKVESTLAQILREPWILNAGQDERAVVVVPDEIIKSSFHNGTSGSLPRVSIMSARTNNITVCRQRSDSSIQQVLQSITHGQDQVAAVAANLHTRIDVDWTSSTSSSDHAVEAEPPSENWAEVSQTMPLG